MAGVNTSIKFSYRDYKSLPESDTKRYELIEGELIVVPSPSTYHQRIAGNLEYILREFVRRYNLGYIYDAPCDVVLSEENVLQPDILFITRERSEIITEENIQGPPDLVIEILSPSTAERDRTHKRTLYARHGVREYWIVDPDERTVKIMILKEIGLDVVSLYQGEARVESPLLSGLVIDLNQIFQ